MADEGNQILVEPHSNAGKWILVLLAVVVVAVAAYSLYVTHTKVSRLENDLAASQAEVKELMNRMQTAEAQGDALRERVGLTKQDLAKRVAELRAQQQAAESRLEAQQKEQIGQVSGEIAGVKTDVGGVKTDVATTKADLEATKAKLQGAMGDLGVQSGLIATTRSDLEALKHKGDRNYYEFTLIRGAKPQPVATVSLELKKTDAKKGKFTLNVTADDKTIEKRDRNIAEPIQFYCGRDHLLYELVVWSVDKNKATGYLSTPKNAPVPVTAN
jgi:uncharacterized protein (UPF0335 family)